MEKYLIGHISLTLCALSLLFTIASSDRPSGLMIKSAGVSQLSSNSYAVVFDGGSTGTRVHVYCFDSNMDLVPIKSALGFYKAIRPGLSAYAGNPKSAADSLKPLLIDAENVVPTALQSLTPVRLGATAGLRLIGQNASDAIIAAVKHLLENDSPFKYNEKWVTVLDGKEEGAYFWVTVNYVLGNLVNKYPETVGIVDMGGGSLQMAYALSKKVAINSPKTEDGEYKYIMETSFRGNKHYLYVHSYLNYGMQAARVEILKAMGSLDNACILRGYKGSYVYNGEEFQVSASNHGAILHKCRRGVLKALKLDTPCEHKNCTFGGVWDGAGGPGQDNLYLGSNFYYSAVEVGFLDPNKTNGVVKAAAYLLAARRACSVSFEAAAETYPRIPEQSLPYLCMDLVYEYSILVNGFGLNPRQEVTVLSKLDYKNYKVEAAWPLGVAIDLLSSSSTFYLSKFSA